MTHDFAVWTPLVPAVLVALVALVLGMTVLVVRRSRVMPGAAGGEALYPTGHWMGLGLGGGIGLGMPLGLVFGLAMDNIALGLAFGPAFGVAIGSALGASLERRHRGQARPLDARERGTRAWIVAAIVGVLALGVLGLTMLLLLSTR